MSPIPDWTFKISEIGKDGRDERLAATPAECTALASALEIPACRSLTVTVRLAPLSRGRFRASGSMRAAVTQSCIVTLEPVEAEIEAPLDIEFWPADDVASQAGASFDALGGDDPEPLDGGRIDLGRIVYELVGARLDPYPRKPGAAFDWTDTRDKAEASVPDPSPFAVLGKLKLKP